MDSKTTFFWIPKDGRDWMQRAWPSNLQFIDCSLMRHKKKYNSNVKYNVVQIQYCKMKKTKYDKSQSRYLSKNFNLSNNNITSFTYLSFIGRLKPLTVHLISGVGLPSALHFRETQGPGWRVWSINEYNKVGRASEKCNELSIILPDWIWCKIFQFKVKNW